MIDHQRTAAGIADDMCSKLEPGDALAVALFTLALVATKTGISLARLDEAFGMVRKMVENTPEVPS